MSEYVHEDGNNTANTSTTAFGFAKHIKNQISDLGLEEAYTAVEVNLDTNEENTALEYSIEASDIYNELENDPETTYHEDSHFITPENGISPADTDLVTAALEDNINSALKVNGEVIRELLSEEYNAF